MTKTTNFVYYVSLPNLCIRNETGSGNSTNLYKEEFWYKTYTSEASPTLAGLSINLQSDTSSTQYLSGTVTGSEGIYTSWIESNAISFNNF